MKLIDYLEKHEIKPLEFAKTVGIKGRVTIYRYINGEAKPRKYMRAICEATNGEVTPADFYDFQ